jgi:aspartate aminotransferase-like enzyme
MGIELWVKQEKYASPTVTAAKVPVGWEWTQFDSALRAEGLVVGGNYGSLAGKVFRIGHMGTQASLPLVSRAMDVVEKALVKTNHPG